MTTGDTAKYFIDERPEFVSFIGQSGSFASAIDIGCAGGKLGTALLHQGIVRTCDGIEPYPAAASIAKTGLGQVWLGSLETVSDEIPWQQYELSLIHI